ncbi:Major Facilitator Superfamily protein [Bosea sp. 62]|uniref:MFS transporter n=1 Tax=unclassified Bosea (in: a-proteobacteria) TaxID=2653178 RepID=UPI001257EA1C|nr:MULTISPECIES: MFS transporter [unclassified Bosea (in: a-proteobacteria)]CAD5254944.1 Major Facilitator Superfamily protein [Bosea sp. 21B]CAD5285414.1 Major Facilitator Superfamily protein [Bosea sp. 7B]CAD5301534.1 Major Facilitator Superfamily protein [Bosea sp. 46]VVT57645.1 Major Facilitator Superfamily protein [Bosea sp. EC-HK365B]VXB28820.1 Major Facilitator Superfamily protein [Bosea sp. 29B]
MNTPVHSETSPVPNAGIGLILALGVTQVAGYGALYYAFAVLAPGMTKSLGWAPEWTYGGFALGLLAGGFAAPLAGRLIDRYGTRRMMSIGCVLASLSLFALSKAEGLISYYAAMIALEVVSTLVLYDAAFTALTQAHGANARRAISKLTLIGGFASTLFWPLTTALLAQADWRSIYQMYALGYLLLALPLHALLLPHGASLHAAKPAQSTVATTGDGYLVGSARRRAFVLLAVAFSLQGFVVSAMSVHMLTLLQGFGFSAALAVTFGAMVGPSQVTGRFIEMLFGTNVPPVTTAWVSGALMPLGFALLVFGGGTAALAGLFAIAYGVSMGLSSIVRGTVPLQLFGPAGYGAMLGKLSAPGLAIRAAAPLAFAVMMERAGLSASAAVLVALSGVAALALLILARAATAEG